MGGMFKKKADSAAVAVSEESAAEVADGGGAEVAQTPVEALPAATPTLAGGGFALPPQRGGLRLLGFTADSSILALATNEPQVVLFDTASCRALSSLRLDVIAFSPGGRFFASKQDGLSIHEVASGDELWNLPGEELVAGHRGWWKILSARFAPGGDSVTLTLDQAATPTSQGHARQLVMLYRVQDARATRLEEYGAGLPLSYNADGSRLAIRLEDRVTVAVVEVPSGQECLRLTSPDAVHCGVYAGETLVLGTETGLAAIGPDGSTLHRQAEATPDTLSISRAGDLIVKTDRHGFALLDAASLATRAQMATSQLPQQTLSDDALRLVGAFSPDGRFLAVAEVPWVLATAKTPEHPACMWEVAGLLDVGQ